MIIISSDLALTLATTIPAGTPWIGYHNLVMSSSISSTTQAAGLPTINLADPATNTMWRGTSNIADEYVTLSNITYGGPIDYLGVARHNFGSNAKAVSVEGRSAGNSPPSAWFELVPPQIVADDTPILFAWTPQILTDVRLRIQPGGAAVPQAAVVYIGKLLVMERGLDIQNDHVPIKYGRRANVISGMSENGNFLGRIVVGEYRESKAEFAHITPSFYRTSVDPFVVASKLIPFFWVWDPSEYPAEVGFAWMINEPQPATSPITRRIAIDFQMRGVA